jgi:hypothetical protein
LITESAAGNKDHVAPSAHLWSEQLGRHIGLNIIHGIPRVIVQALIMLIRILKRSFASYA